ncbi:MAG: type II toxin-antitoxin system HicA family toxin [Caulobacteraceae bacterium]|nr:type II toxin-antitoxin system HicA family toxin [Caulobacter sp.]
MTFRQVVEILLENGFIEARHGATSHRRFRAEIKGEVALVTVAYHRLSDEPAPNTLQSIIRQSRLPKSAFRR